MTNTLLRRIRKLRKRTNTTVLVTCAVFVGLFMYAGYMSNKQTSIDPTAYAPLLNLIAKAESNGNYNAHFGNPYNIATNFTGMSVAEVLAWQENFVQQGSPSSAVGRYQIISTTLSDLVSQLGIDANQKFDQATQDRMAIALLERRGAVEYENNRITREEFAANLAKEWAALPKVIGDNPTESYYASDGLNKSRVEIGEVLAVISRANS